MRPRFDPDARLMGRIHHSLASGRVTNHGPLEQEFELALADYLGVDHGVAVSSCATGLLLAARALGATTGKAILPAFTFIATLAAVAHVGLTPVFCDIDPHTWTLCPQHLAVLLRQHRDVRLVCPVNAFGVPPAMDVIVAAARGAGAAVLYDNAHGLGTRDHGEHTPGGVDAQVFSLHATKTLPAIEGGFVVGDAGLMDEVRRLRQHGLDPDLARMGPGYNARMSELHAAVGLHSLERLEVALATRRAAFHRLRSSLGGMGYTVQAIPQGVDSNAQNLGVLMPAGSATVDAWIADWLREGVEVRRYFHPLLHHLGGTADGAAALPHTEAVSARLLCLPMHNWLDDQALARIERAAGRLTSHTHREGTSWT